MGPAKQKEPHVREAPSWIDPEFVKNLKDIDKKDYWERRLKGLNGQEDLTPKPKVIKTPDNITIGFDNEGKMIAKTRAYRRKKLPTDNTKTKKQNKRKK